MGYQKNKLTCGDEVICINKLNYDQYNILVIGRKYDVLFNIRGHLLLKDATCYAYKEDCFVSVDEYEKNILEQRKIKIKKLIRKTKIKKFLNGVENR